MKTDRKVKCLRLFHGLIEKGSILKRNSVICESTGTGSGKFSPADACTRAQIVTFLWRTAGSPAPKGMSSFTDVPADAYYAKAVAWAAVWVDVPFTAFAYKWLKSTSPPTKKYLGG